MKKNNINLNINNDDNSLNDYIYCWSELGSKPSKTVVHGYFKPDVFLDYLEKLNVTQISNFVDVLPNEETPIVNENIFLSIENQIYVSYTYLDRNHAESIIGEVCIFYLFESTERVNEIVNSLLDLIIDSEANKDEKVNSSNNLSMLSLNQNGFELEYFELSKDFEDIDYYYQDEVLKKVKKLTKSIKKEKKGISIVVGERGCGKTNLISYISTKVDKNFIFVPCNLIESSINNPEFIKFLKINRNSVLIIDDSELYYSQLYSKSTFYSTNLLQLVEGLYSSVFDLNVVLGMNCELSEIDETIINSNNILDVIEINKLSVSKINDLCEFLGKKSKFQEPTKLVEVFRNKSNINKTNELGFR